jgi:hypothetical protein
MTDLSKTIAPKSDQLNADDLITSPMTITVTKVSLLTEADQPIAINFEGDAGKPFKPCKSMRRVLVMCWGPDGAKFAGRSMTLYRDPSVKFGGADVGGIRISHLSDITKPITMALTASKASRKPYTVQPLSTKPPAGASTSPPAQQPARKSIPVWLNDLEAELAQATSAEEVFQIVSGEQVQKAFGAFKGEHLERLEAITAAADERFPPPAMSATADIDDEIPF